jgi:hypothetical protein
VEVVVVVVITERITKSNKPLIELPFTSREKLHSLVKFADIIQIIYNNTFMYVLNICIMVVKGNTTVIYHKLNGPIGAEGFVIIQ